MGIDCCVEKRSKNAVEQGLVKLGRYDSRDVSVLSVASINKRIETAQDMEQLLEGNKS